MKETTLLIMAAGIGSRFGGGIKQLEPVGLQGEIIMDYSVHDAIEAGFNRIVFIIRRDIEKDFKERIGDRIEEVAAVRGIRVEYCFQDPRNIPGEFPEGRCKPWGTGQAVLAAKDLITGPFCVINADDYYGKEAFRRLHEWLIGDHKGNELSMAGFILRNTLSDNGGVTRGICCMSACNHFLKDVIETKNIIKTPEGPEADGVKIPEDAYVSMNFWGFPAKEGEKPLFLDILERGFEDFFAREVALDPMKAEYLLPILIGRLLREDRCSVEVLETGDRWFGVTYKEDKAAVVASFKELIAAGVYREELYSDLPL